ncbi:MAG TPA: CmcJ/NvfI family oxidoreductase [Polyangiaceae bacterium]|jgi:hypothetical protein
MSMEAAGRDAVRYVETSLTYLGDVQGTPTNYLDRDPPQGVPARYARVKHLVRIYDARTLVPQATLDTQGFQLVGDPEGVLTDFREERAVREVYYPAVDRLLRRVVGARKVLIFDHTYRSSMLAQRAANGTDTAVDEVHNDYTARSGPERVRELLQRHAPQEDAVKLMAGRFGIFNVWRPINGVVEQKPLTICDLRSMRQGDFVDAELKWPHRTGYVCAVRFNPEHRWYYFSRQEEHEATVFQCYDSVARNGARFGAHTAFDDPRSPAGAKARESIEVRAIAFFAES